MDIRTIGKLIVGVVCFGLISFGFSTLRPGQFEDAVETMATVVFWVGLVWLIYKWAMSLIESAARRSESRKP